MIWEVEKHLKTKLSGVFQICVRTINPEIQDLNEPQRTYIKKKKKTQKDTHDNEIDEHHDKKKITKILKGKYTSHVKKKEILYTRR